MKIFEVLLIESVCWFYKYTLNHIISEETYNRVILDHKTIVWMINERIQKFKRFFHINIHNCFIRLSSILKRLMEGSLYSHSNVFLCWCFEKQYWPYADINLCVKIKVFFLHYQNKKKSLEKVFESFNSKMDGQRKPSF